MKKFPLAFAVLISLGAVSEAQAITSTCESCTPAQAKQMANQKLHGYGYYRNPRPLVYIVDTVQGLSYKFRYRWSVTPGGAGDGDDEVTVWLEQLPVEPQIVSGIQAVKAAASDSRHIYDTTSPGLPYGAYQSVDRPDLERNISLNIQGRHQAIAQAILNLAGLAYSGFTSYGVSVSLVWHYPDSSTAVFVYNPQTQVWVRDPSETRDRNGNLVPTTRLDYSGGDDNTRTHYFPPGNTNIADFLHRASGLGINVINGSAASNSGSARTSTCAIVNSVTTCIVQTVSW